MDTMMGLMTKISEKLDNMPGREACAPGGGARGDNGDGVLNFYGK